MKTKIFISALAVVLSVGLVTAQNQDQDNKEKTATQNGPAFVDKDNNGVCDNFENGTPGNPNANGTQRLRRGGVVYLATRMPTVHNASSTAAAGAEEWATA